MGLGRLGRGMEADGSARADGRGLRQLRELSFSRAPLVRADGSCEWRQGGSHVICAVHGPMAPSSSGRPPFPDRAAVEVSLTPLVGQRGSRERCWERVLDGILRKFIIVEDHPRACIKVALQVLREDGSMLACCVCAATAALCDAGVPLRSLAVGVGLASGISSNSPKGSLCLDPSSTEEDSCAAHHTLVFEVSESKEGPVPPLDDAPRFDAELAAVESLGTFSPADLAQALKTGASTAKRLAEYLRGALGDTDRYVQYPKSEKTGKKAGRDSAGR